MVDISIPFKYEITQEKILKIYVPNNVSFDLDYVFIIIGNIHYQVEDGTSINDIKLYKCSPEKYEAL